MTARLRTLRAVGRCSWGENFAPTLREGKEHERPALRILRRVPLPCRLAPLGEAAPAARAKAGWTGEELDKQRPDALAALSCPAPRTPETSFQQPGGFA